MVQPISCTNILTLPSSEFMDHIEEMSYKYFGFFDNENIIEEENGKYV